MQKGEKKKNWENEQTGEKKRRLDRLSDSFEVREEMTLIM